MYGALNDISRFIISHCFCALTFAEDEPTDIVTKDNRNLVDSTNNQQLTNEEINNLRKQGVTGGVCCHC